jgi:hypothetical protein
MEKTLQKVVEAQSLLSGVGKAKESEGAKCCRVRVGYLELGESECTTLNQQVF